jgi:hypothetical protein
VNIPHPKPYQSALWPYLPLIRKRRLARRSWPEIAAELKTFGVSVHPDTINRFFARVQKGKVPRGFAEDVEAGSAAQEIVVQPVPSDLPLIGPDGKDPLLDEIPPDSPWAPKKANDRKWQGVIGKWLGNSR